MDFEEPDQEAPERQVQMMDRPKVALALALLLSLFAAITCKGDQSPVGSVGLQGPAGPQGPVGAAGAAAITNAKIEDDELEFIGIVDSFTETELVLEDGTTFVINDDTEMEASLRLGMEVEVDAIESDGKLTAIVIDIP